MTNLKQIVEVLETSLISLISVNRNVLSFQSDHHLIQWSTIYNISRPQSSTNVFFIAFCSTTDRVVCQRIRSVFPRKVHFSYTFQLNPIPRGSKINHTNPINSNFYWTTLFYHWTSSIEKHGFISNIITAILIINYHHPHLQSNHNFQVLGLGAGAGEDNQACCPLWTWKPHNHQWSISFLPKLSHYGYIARSVLK